MKKSDFYFELPQNLIAQTPIEPRDSSRLLVMSKDTGEISHHIFTDIYDLLEPGDLLVLNNSRVLPARLYGTKSDTGSKIEFLLLDQKENNIWEILVKPGKKAKNGTKFSFGNGILNAEILDVLPDGNRICKFSYEGNFYNILEQIGNMPLPPYITEKLNNKERYQTVYSKIPGSSAAPTAGLHFTPELMDRLLLKGVNIAYVTLHVGLGTFRPVKEDIIENHKMHTEHFVMPQETADMINKTKQNGKRVFAVGTTSCRTIESVAQFNGGKVTACDSDTGIFIYPGYKFQVMDGLITNFHLPESTLIMLVSAFAGYSNTMNAYKTAVEEKYRFFSFGDAMLIC